MIVNTEVQVLPYKSVSVDLLTRDGPPGPDNYPFEGLRHHILGVKARDLPYAATFEYMTHRSHDYDFRKQNTRISIGDAPIRTIEDVSIEEIKLYFEALLYRYTMSHDGGFPNYKKQNLYVQRGVMGEDGAVFSETELMNDDYDVTPEEAHELRRKLPYLLSRLHTQSKRLGISLMSIIIAYERCMRADQTKTPKPIKLVEKGVYYMDNKGNITGQMKIVMGTFPHRLHNWIAGRPGFINAYYYDTLELREACRILGIQLIDDDATLYDEAFISELVTDYIINEDDLLLSVASSYSFNLSPKFMNAVSQMTIDDLPQLLTAVNASETSFYSEDVKIEQPLEERISAVIEMAGANEQLYTRRNTKEVKQALINLHAAAVTALRYPLLTPGMHTYNGFYRDSQNNFIRLNVLALNTGAAAGKAVILHASGMAILVPNEVLHLDKLHVVSFQTLSNILNRYARLRDAMPEEERLIPWETIRL